MGGKSDTQTQSVQIPQFLRPFVEQQAQTGAGALGNLQGQLGNAGAEQLVSPFNADQQAAFNLARQATGQGGAIPTALNALQQTAAGDFLFGGQGFDAAVDAAMRQAQPHILSTFGAAGRGTGGLAQTAMSQAATDAFARQFGQERQNQLTAAQLLPRIASQGVGLLSDIGGQQQQLAQQQLTAPITAQQMLLQAAGGGVPLQSLFGQTQQMSSNPLGGALGGGLAGLGLASSLFPASEAAAAAGGLGALSSLSPLGLAGFGAGGLLLGGLL
jgi:hypothetical protein